MFEAIRDYTEPFAEKIGLVVHDVRTGAVFSRNPDRVFPSASVIKLAILWEFYRRVAEGSLNPEEPYVLHDDVKEGTTPYDTGILRDFHDGLVLTLQDIVTMMIVISDDTATNILIDRFGKEAINESMSRIGLTHTRVQRRMMEYDKVRAGAEIRPGHQLEPALPLEGEKIGFQPRVRIMVAACRAGEKVMFVECPHSFEVLDVERKMFNSHKRSPYGPTRRETVSGLVQ